MSRALTDPTMQTVEPVQVFEYCESDLEVLIKDRRTLLSAADIKAYMQMILAALAFCHRNWVLHRDIKPNNFLITKDGEPLYYRVLASSS